MAKPYLKQEAPSSGQIIYIYTVPETNLAPKNDGFQ